MGDSAFGRESKYSVIWCIEEFMWEFLHEDMMDFIGKRWIDLMGAVEGLIICHTTPLFVLLLPSRLTWSTTGILGNMQKEFWL